LIEAALTAHTDVVVTGDQNLPTMGHVGRTEILTPREFLESPQLGT
jgi:predicted nucleic acid-binding protein